MKNFQNTACLGLGFKRPGILQGTYLQKFQVLPKVGGSLQKFCNF